ncbi:MAG: hypothetical protein UZ13_03495 [Chloroflexi bacterium OLB13]|nr:MAG: hypothetical protein UZ13_03495 [Chloroflexi bacterium OLB13]
MGWHVRVRVDDTLIPHGGPGSISTGAQGVAGLVFDRGAVGVILGVGEDRVVDRDRVRRLTRRAVDLRRPFAQRRKGHARAHGGHRRVIAGERVRRHVEREERVADALMDVAVDDAGAQA